MWLEDQLQKQGNEYKNYVYNLEKKSVLDKDRWAGHGGGRQRGGQEPPRPDCRLPGLLMGGTALAYPLPTLQLLTLLADLRRVGEK